MLVNVGCENTVTKTNIRGIMKFKEFVKKDNTFQVPMILKHKEKALNPKTNRMKNKHLTLYHETEVQPKDRTFKNLPRYANDKPKVRFQDWLLIKSEKARPSHSVQSIGKSEATGAWWGWSHRAVYGFKVGDKIEGDSAAKKVTFPKLPDGTWDWDNGVYEPDFTIKTNAQAKQCAITFVDSVS